MAKKRNGAATTAGSTLSRLTEQFQVQAMRLRLWAQKEYGKRSVQNLMKGSDDEKASASPLRGGTHFALREMRVGDISLSASHSQKGVNHVH